MTPQLLAQAMGIPVARAALWAGPLKGAFDYADLDTRERQAAFLAQIGHESGGLSQVVENLNYSAAGLVATWPSRFSSASAQLYARQPQKIANHVYGGRMGNTQPGDGWKFRGRGLIQTTGRENYARLTRNLLPLCSPDFTEMPEMLEQPRWAALSAADYWRDRKLNKFCTPGDVQFAALTRAINGGVYGLADRIARYERAFAALGT